MFGGLESPSQRAAAGRTLYFENEIFRLDALEDRGQRAAHFLAALGVQPGATIAVLMRNEPALIEVLTAIRCLQGLRALIPWHLTPAEIAKTLARLSPTLLIAHADLLAPLCPALRAHAPLRVITVPTPAVIQATYHFPPGDGTGGQAPTISWHDLVQTAKGSLPLPGGAPQALSLTSGTTGQAKVVRWAGTQRWDAWNGQEGPPRPTIQTSVVTAPLYFGGQYGVFSQAWRLGANLVFLPKFEPEAFLSAVERHRATHAYMVPTQFVRLLRLHEAVRRHYDVSSLNYILHTGATCPLDIKRQMIDWWGPIFWEAYGTTETATVSVCSSAEWLVRPGTVGRPARPVLIRDELGNDLGVGEIGRIHVEVTNMPAVTFNGHAAPRVTAQGQDFLPTGDVGYRDGDGYLYVTGRADDLINTGRVKVYPLEIESVLLQHPQVQDCAVFALPDPEFGQKIGAVVQAQGAPTTLAGDLQAFLSSQLSEHKIPARLWIQAEPLRAESGKLNRVKLAKRLESGQGEPVA